MSVGDSAEHDELRQVVPEFLSERSPSSEVRRLMEAGESRDDEVWALLAGQLGLTGIAVPERYGGAGYGPVELGIVLEEMGAPCWWRRTSPPSPWPARPWPPPAMRKRWRAGCPVSPTARSPPPSRSPRNPGRGTWPRWPRPPGRPARLGRHRHKLFVIDGHTADLLLVVAHAPDGPGVFGVERGAAGVRAGDA